MKARCLLAIVSWAGLALALFSIWGCTPIPSVNVDTPPEIEPVVIITQVVGSTTYNDRFTKADTVTIHMADGTTIKFCPASNWGRVKPPEKGDQQ